MYYAIGLLILALSGWGAYENFQASNWHQKYSSLQASYTQAALKAETDAKAKEAADLKNLQNQSSQAISRAKTEADTAHSQLQAYLDKGKKAPQNDLGHQCFNVPIPADEIP